MNMPRGAVRKDQPSDSQSDSHKTIDSLQVTLTYTVGGRFINDIQNEIRMQKSLKELTLLWPQRLPSLAQQHVGKT